MSVPLLPRRFPWARPTWPGGVERPAVVRRTGVSYDTSWARRRPARLVRAVVLEGLTRPLVQALASPTVIGRDRLEGLEGPAIFAANHASHVDTPLILAALPSHLRRRTVVAAGADYFFDRRWKAGLWALAVNAIPVERHRVSPTSTRLAADVLTDGWNLVIFPEGGRSPDGWSRHHRPGAAYLAVRTGAPVVPVYVHGTRRILRKGGRGVRRSHTRLSFGHPLRPAAAEDARRFAARVEGAVAILADEQASGFWVARRRAAAGATPALTGPRAGAWRRSWTLEEGRRPPDSAPRWPAP